MITSPLSTTRIGLKDTIETTIQNVEVIGVRDMKEWIGKEKGREIGKEIREAIGMKGAIDKEKEKEKGIGKEIEIEIEVIGKDLGKESGKEAEIDTRTTTTLRTTIETTPLQDQHQAKAILQAKGLTSPATVANIPI
jgi:hypothetical protein